MLVSLTGPALSVRTCARRLAPLGFQPVREPEIGSGADSRLVLGDAEHPGGGDRPPLEVDLSWFGPAEVAGRSGSEAVVQAMSGLMALHGADADGPRRIGLEIASVGTGMLAAQAVAAAAIGRRRGLKVGRVRSSVLSEALLVACHRIAAATSGDRWVPAPPGPAPGPPFYSAEERPFEIETLDTVAWRGFWARLGADQVDLEWAWRQFRTRYFRGTCSLPEGLHEATRAHPLGAIESAAEACGVSLCRVRSYEQVLDDPDPSAGHPSVRSFPAGPPEGEPAGAAPSGAELPLAGLRVVEATSRMQGPLAGLLLQMLGAHVTHVEPPVGDFTRTVPPLVEDEGTFFRCFNRGKEAIKLDLARPGGRAQLRELVADADVFLHNWRPGKATEWSLDVPDLAAVNPGLVYACASGWGDDPGMAGVLGTDYLVQAHAGVGAGITPEAEPAAPSRVLLTDHLGALVTTEAILSGLYRRQRTHRGQSVGASLLDGAMALQAHVLDALVDGQEKGRRNGRPVWGVLDQPLETADGLLAVSIRDDTDLCRLARICGVEREESAGGPVEPVLAERIAEAGTALWQERLAEADIPAAAVRTDLASLVDDPRLAGLLESLGGTAVAPAAPWRLDP